MGWWSDFDRGEVAEEFDLIAELGMGIARIFLLWEDFQPTPDSVDPKALDHLGVVCDLAADRGLRLDVTFFTGHMSGPNWAPEWLLDGSTPAPDARLVVSGGRVVGSGYRNPYVDGVALRAQRLLVTRVADRFRDHPAIWAWNLGNEPDLMAVPPDAASGPAWARMLTDSIREVDDRHPVTCGLHLPSLTSDNGLRVDRIFASADLSTMHAYSIYSSLATGATDPDFVAFACALTAALAGRPVLAEEFGSCTTGPGEPRQTWHFPIRGVERAQVILSEEDLAEHLALVLPRLVAVGSVGALLWCFADYHSSLWDRPPCLENVHERFFGLVRPDGSVKPHALVVRNFARTRPVVQAPPEYARIDVDPDVYYRDPAGNFASLYAEFRRAGGSTR
jgi:endo-1,4-beta-mannosidase